MWDLRKMKLDFYLIEFRLLRSIYANLIVQVLLFDYLLLLKTTKSSIEDPLKIIKKIKK